jgi:signal transduction histidine kinase
MAAMDGWTATRPAYGRPFALRSAASALALALLLGVAVAMEYLFQPFVWRNWPVGEVLLGWLPILGARIGVALAMGTAGWLVLQASWRLPMPARGLLYAFVVVTAALATERALQLAGAADAGTSAADIAFRVLRWSTLALGTAALLLTWRRALGTDDALRRAEQQRLRADLQLADLRLQALQSQIEPHFLFNTLATARRLGGTDPGQCARLLEHLHDFLRLGRVATPGRLRWRLHDELELVRAYLGVIEMRMGGRLRLRYDIAPETEGCEIPPLALATLVENAVKHGIAPSADGGEIAVAAHCEDRQGSAGGAVLVLSVTDSGVGFGVAATHGGTGIGLANTRARLQNLYGRDAALTLAANVPRGAVAQIHMPALAA